MRTLFSRFAQKAAQARDGRVEAIGLISGGRGDLRAGAAIGHTAISGWQAPACVLAEELANDVIGLSLNGFDLLVQTFFRRPRSVGEVKGPKAPIYQFPVYELRVNDPMLYERVEAGLETWVLPANRPQHKLVHQSRRARSPFGRLILPDFWRDFLCTLLHRQISASSLKYFGVSDFITQRHHCF
jgi:hypothetical protein